MKLLVVAIFILMCVSTWSRPGVATYYEATDVFEIMDHVSMWHRDLPKAYRKAWLKKFSLSLEDKSYLSKYKDLRLKYHKEINEGRDIFGTMPIGYDKLSEAFYTSRSVGEALKKLKKKKIDKADIKFLKIFYGHFKERISAFVKQSTRFQVTLIDFNKKWRATKVKVYLSKLTKFVLGKQGRKVKILMRPVWYPEGIPSRVDLRGPFLILRYNPLDSHESWDIQLLIKSAVKAIMQGQPVNQRTNLSKIFEEQCRGRSPEFEMMLETVFARMLPESYKEKKNFELYKRWHQKNYIDVYSKLVYPLAMREMKGKDYFSGDFMEKAALLCKQVHDLAYVP